MRRYHIDQMLATTTSIELQDSDWQSEAIRVDAPSHITESSVSSSPETEPTPPVVVSRYPPRNRRPPDRLMTLNFV